jgi:hypothetical protein
LRETLHYAIFRAMTSRIAREPRPWLTRAAGECAWPIDGEGWRTRSCCNPCPGEDYCPAHKDKLFRPATPIAEVIAGLAAMGLCIRS